ncbi:benzoate 4-monooxygenase cytochrome P450 [Aspergillus steynii IBT 23096]|uniref:Benzoate 4-monooxygenase cytochrome P450 n=1 Tax=Aspergillus steynii IBT 23096 TaxID=1392250 RepID=A0A2I2GSM8_9EURO|nr:benzoate 4-monooxygenase cytochrome P450 [Aspergillus steynii IBT 23096]PLB55889.1 benzoate 4-monooxygenase cytochrome P450 [Aspergillus steynii IBT 23096]
MGSIPDIKLPYLGLSLLWAPVLAITFLIWRGIFNIYFHPLSKYPGPRLAALSHFCQSYWTFTGTLHSKLKDLHDQYGEVVRIGPNMLVYRNAQAWKNICGHRKSGDGGPMLLEADDANHSRQRRLLAHAFSDRALREQEPTLRYYVDLLMRQLNDSAASNEAVDVTKWFNYITFDIIGDLAFGEPFACLKNKGYHPWVASIFQNAKGGCLMRPFRTMLPSSLLSILMPAKLTQMREKHQHFSREKVRERLSRQTTRPDFWTYVLRHNDEKGMTVNEMEANADLLIIAGSETTASVLSGCVYYLLKNPAVHQKLLYEIRGAFDKDEDINLMSIGKLSYLHAVLEESLRLYPPVPAILPRRVPQGGALINGEFVPEQTSVSVAWYSSFRASTNFTDPDAFLPERWLLDNKDPRFASDKKEVLQPFSYGPRNCLGKNLAYAEMRLIATKLLWNFDMAFEEECERWDEQKAYNIWEKPPLNVKLTPVHH